MNPGAKFYCSPGKWERMARAAAVEAGLDPVRLLSGDGQRQHVTVRWRLWRQLATDGFSYLSIARASGFDHSSVIHAVRATHEPRLYTAVAAQ